MWRKPIVNEFPYVMLLQRRILGDEAHCQAPRRITWCSWQSAKAVENLVYFVEANERPPCASKAKRHNLVNLGSFCRSPTLQADSNVWNFHVSRAHHSHQSHPGLLRSLPPSSRHYGAIHLVPHSGCVAKDVENVRAYVVSELLHRSPRVLM